MVVFSTCDFREYILVLIIMLRSILIGTSVKKTRVLLQNTSVIKSRLSTALDAVPVEKQEQPLTVDPEKVIADALKHPDYFRVREFFTVEDLFEARVHYGHKEGSLDDRMKPYLFGSRLGHLIFDLDITADHLRRALNFTAHVAFQGGVILFVARSPQLAHLVEQTAKECGEYAHVRYWRLGMFTNSSKMFGAITRLPDLVIFINTLNDVLAQHLAVLEAAKMVIPTIGIVDTNCNPNLISYPVPGNDDSLCAVQLYCNLFKKAILVGKEQRRLLKLDQEYEM